MFFIITDLKYGQYLIKNMFVWYFIFTAVFPGRSGPRSQQMEISGIIFIVLGKLSSHDDENIEIVRYL